MVHRYKLMNMVALLNPNMLCNCEPLCSLSSSWSSPALTSHHDHNEDHDDDRHDDHHDDNDDPGKTGSWERRVQAGWWWGGPPYYCNHTGPNIIEVAVVVVVVLPVQLVVLAIELWGLQQHYWNSTFISYHHHQCWHHVDIGTFGTDSNKIKPQNFWKVAILIIFCKVANLIFFWKVAILIIFCKVATLIIFCRMEIQCLLWMGSWVAPPRWTFIRSLSVATLEN